MNIEGDVKTCAFIDIPDVRETRENCDECNIYLDEFWCYLKI